LVLDLFDRRFQTFQELTRVISSAFNKTSGLYALSDLRPCPGKPRDGTLRA